MTPGSDMGGGLAVERFDYSRVGTEWAVLDLLTRLGTALSAPADAGLVIRRGQEHEDLVFPTRASHYERRLNGPAAAGAQTAGSSELLWRASFAVPFEVVEFQQALFELTAGGNVALALPAPGVRLVDEPALRLVARGRGVTRVQRIAASGARHRVAALATLVAVTITSTPAAAIAAVGLKTHTKTQAETHANTHAKTHARAARKPAKVKPAVSSSPTGTIAPVSITLPSTRFGPRREGARLRQLMHPSVTHIFSSSATPAPGLALHLGQPGTGAPGPAPGSTKPSGASSTGTTHPSGKRGRKRTSTARHVGKRSGHRGRRHTIGERIQSPRGPSAHSPAKLRTPTAPSSLPTVPTLSGPTVPTLSGSPAGFTGPTSWTGTVTTDPSLAGALTNLSGLLADGNNPPQFLIPIYMEAGHRYGIPWQVLAGINAVESDFGRNMSTSSAGAIGWMQFMPATWKQWGVAADGHSVANPYDPRDAIFSAARYLAAAGGAQDISRGVFAYNHASWYVDEVMARAQSIARHVNFRRAAVKRGTISVYFATARKKHPIVRFKGGWMSHYDRLISSANMVSAANFAYLYGGGHEQPARFGPFDCSGSVSYVMQQAGYKVPTTVSGEIPVWRFPAGPGRVTIFYNPGHTFMRIGNRYFGTSGFARPGGGAGWFDTNRLPVDYLAGFGEVHVPKLGVNSFARPRIGQEHS